MTFKISGEILHYTFKFVGNKSPYNQLWSKYKTDTELNIC